MSCTSDVETESKTHDTIETSCEVLEWSAEKTLQYTAQDPSEAHLEVHVDSDWAGDTATRRSTDRAERSTFAPTQFNSSERDWTQQCRK